MQLNSVALPGPVGAWALLSLIDLDTNGPVVFGISRAESAFDIFEVWGSLDGTAVGGEANLTLLEASLSAANGKTISSDLARQLATWPFLLVRRTAGSTAGTFYAVGNPSSSSSPLSVALPGSVGLFSALLSTLVLTAQANRIGLSKGMTSSDVFNVYGATDAAVTDKAGAVLLGEIRGGAALQSGYLSSLLQSGWPYVLCERLSGSTAGRLIAAAPLPIGGGSVGSSILQGGNSFGAPVDIGSNDNQPVLVRTTNNAVVISGGGASGSVVLAGGTGATGLVEILAGTNAALLVHSVPGADTSADGHNAGELDAAHGVDIAGVIKVPQTTGGGARVAVLPVPTVVPATRRVTVINTGVVALVMYGKIITPIAIPQTSRCDFIWDGSAWGSTA